MKKNSLWLVGFVSGSKKHRPKNFRNCRSVMFKGQYSDESSLGERGGQKNMGESSSKVKKTSPLKRQKMSVGHVQRPINGDESLPKVKKIHPS
jgi:hypothetical protein